MRTIARRHNPIVASFRAAALARGTDRRHLLLDGARLIEDARSAGAAIEVALFAAAGVLDTDTPLARLAEALDHAGAETLAASESVLRAASPVRTPSGVVALATHRPRTAGQVVTVASHGLIVAAVGVQDPGNVGAIIRAADAGGAQAVVVAGDSADPFAWKALRGAMGSSFRIPIATTQDVASLVDDAHAHGMRVIAAVPRGGAGIYEADLAGPRLVLVGREGAGLDDDIDLKSDLRVSIPMRHQVDSLNVAVAAALIIYEARRQSLRRRRGGRSPARTGSRTRSTTS